MDNPNEISTRLKIGLLCFVLLLVGILGYLVNSELSRDYDSNVLFVISNSARGQLQTN